MSTKITKGIFFVATGTKFIAEACRSAKTIKEFIPDVSITAYFNETIDCPYIDEIRSIENPTFSFADKISPFIDPPYDHNIFIDTDTVCMEDFSEIFGVLEKHDLGITHCVIRDCAKELRSAPEWFPELNTGVIVFKKGATEKLFRDWLAKHDEYREIKGMGFNDQPAFRYCLYHSGLKWTVLPREYNMRPVHGWLAAGHAKVKILHGRGYPLRKGLREINRITHKHRGSHLKPRVGKLSFLERIWWSLLCKMGLDEK